MSTLSSLQSDLAYWNNRVDALKIEIESLKKRKTDVGNVKNILVSIAGSDSSMVNGQMQTAKSNLLFGIDYSNKNALLHSIFEAKEEQPATADADVSFADHNLKQELDNIENKLCDLNNDLNTATQKVSSIKSAIAAEERRIREAEEARRRAAAEAANQGPYTIP